MGANSKIEWTDHTFSPWLGCQVVSPACDRCYAKAFAKRTGYTGKERPSGKPILPLLWGGASTSRHVVSDATWRHPEQWNASAAARGVIESVFCASMSDFFEGRPDLVEPRARLRRLIAKTTALRWLILTKRPQNADRLMLAASLAMDGPVWPSNVWLGTTVESRRYADERIPELRKVPAAVRFLSIEPLLEDLGVLDLTGIGWVIVGGETGSGARPMHPAWARSIRDQCVAAGVAFHFKQWGDWAPRVDESKLIRDGQHVERKAHKWMLANGSTGLCWLSSAEGPWLNWTDGTEGLGEPDDTAQVFSRVGKKRAGRLLDGRTWDEFPNQQPKEGQRA